jgi:hypothetical protein
MVEPNNSTLCVILSMASGVIGDKGFAAITYVF